jgi:signal peptidase II
MAPATTRSAAGTARPGSRPLCFYLAAAVITVLDQVTKVLMVRQLALGASVPFLGPVASLTLTHNRGSAMGLLPGGGQFLAVVAALVIIAIAVLGPRYARANRLAWWGLCLLLGGALGNLLDRARLGYVVDFINFHFWPVFNVADIAVVCGAILMVIALVGRREATAPSEV